MRWKSHVRFGRRAAETDRSRDRHRAAARPHTEHPTAEGKLYLCAVKDTCSGRIVGYSIDSRMKASLAVAALRHAIARRSPAGTVVHSGRSVPFDRLPAALKNNGLIGSMGRSAPAATTPPWSPSSHSCRRTCSTGTAGPPGRNCGWRSSPGSRGPTTAAGDNADSDASPRSNTKHSPAPQQRPNTYPDESTEVGAVPRWPPWVSASVVALVLCA
jgi:hypothetical protein